MTQKTSFFIVALVLLPLAAVAQPMIQSQEGIALQNQILQLQQQVQQLQSGGGGGGSSLGGGSAPPEPSQNNGAMPDSSVVTNLLNQVNQLQTQVQDLNGRVDTLQNQVNTQNAAMEKEIGDLKFQIGNGGTPGAPGAPGSAPATQNGPGAPPDLAPPPPASSATPPADPADPKLALRGAEAAMAKHDYRAAEQNARAVLATSKSSPEGYKAQYILAQALYGQNKPQDAAIAYDDAYNRARDGTYAPGSLLGLANSLTAIHQQSAACDTLASLNSQFPTPPKGMGPAIEAAGRRAHCSS